MLCAFAIGTSEFIIVGVLPEVAADLSVDLPTAGLLVTAYAFMIAVGGPVLTVLAGRLPRRGLLIGLMALCTGAAALSAVASNYPMLMIARVLGLLTTIFAFTGMIAAFTYVSPTLREVTGFSSGWVTGVLLVYGLGTVVGSTLAGKVRPESISRVLPIPLAVLGGGLLLQGFLMHAKGTSLIALFLLGASAFTVGPLVHTYLMDRAGPAAGFVASVNISAFNVAAALGPLLGGAVISGGLGLDRGGGDRGGAEPARVRGRAAAAPGTPAF
ncbi:MFS transporter [Herbihabitans rhizosphaerae]|uniref:MFS transporter n=1 Tax=Herbihabitans rhizosphaerae TaxID=1872711 RepID=A0A4Q7L6W8_9PSEU|nr:MFS transporter [Herbihabitans rhizosphaerae]RZS45115.1 MFS transporter [Herbihabitans rhizosphaerae]